MKSATVGTLSGCGVWLVTVFILSSCLVPAAAVIGSITSTVTGDFVVRTLTPYLCPEGSRGEIFTYATTMVDEDGVERPSTGYEMRCVDSGGRVVKDLGASYAFVWIGILAAVGLLVSLVLALVLAAPAGALIARIARRVRKPVTDYRSTEHF